MQLKFIVKPTFISKTVEKTVFQKGLQQGWQIGTFGGRVETFYIDTVSEDIIRMLGYSVIV